MYQNIYIYDNCSYQYVRYEYTIDESKLKCVNIYGCQLVEVESNIPKVNYIRNIEN
jgi:hypothetical protein